MVLDDDLAIDLTPDAEGTSVVFSVELAPLPEDVSLPALREMLEANLDPALTGGGSLSIDPERGEIILVPTLPLASMTAELMDSVLAAFTDAVRF